MKRVLSLVFALVLLAAALFPAPAAAAPAQWVTPTFSIVSVAADQSVTVRTANFPANDSFDVLMNIMGTRGVNGIRVGTLASGAGGALTQTYTIPAALRGLYQISIRIQSTSGSGYYAFNWFYNNTAGGSGTGGAGDGTTGGTGYTGIPTFSIVSVAKGQSVTVQTQNLPANDNFRVLMGAMGTRGVNGYAAGTFDTKAGGKQQLTFTIPAEMANAYQVAIRMESTKGTGYYAFNWFYNNTAGGSGTGGAGDGTTGGTGYTGFPSFSINRVVRNQSVTITTRNLPANDNFQVFMNVMGTLGVNGYAAGSFNTGAGGTQQLTFTIPAQLANLGQISIRMQSTSGSGYYAFNWFWNNTTP